MFTHLKAHLRAAAILLLTLTVITGIAYPLLITGIGQGAFGDKADGSLVRDANGNVLGSSQIGQQFTSPRYFHPRPSSAGDGYEADNSAASNLGPASDVLIKAVGDRAVAYRRENLLGATVEVPVDAVTASGSGLDPEISPANAYLQAGRIAQARGVSEAIVIGLIDSHKKGRSLGILGEPRVNVLELNVALDRL